MAELLGGQVDILCDQTTNTTAQIASGRVRAYGVTTLQPLRTPGLAKLPTLDSQGLKGFNVTIWHGLYAPRGTPAAVTERLNAALRTALAQPGFVRRQEQAGAVTVNDARLTPAGHKRFVADEIRRWGEAIRAAGRYAD
jgi:tripartite-type tricarboxylate transporter receptor subunit TctC